MCSRQGGNYEYALIKTFFMLTLMAIPFKYLKYVCLTQQNFKFKFKRLPKNFRTVPFPVLQSLSNFIYILQNKRRRILKGQPEHDDAAEKSASQQIIR